LESLAPDLREPCRLLAEDLGAPFEEILHEVQQEQARMVQLLAGGHSLEDLLERQAAEHGVSVEELERELDVLELKYF